MYIIIIYEKYKKLQKVIKSYKKLQKVHKYKIVIPLYKGILGKNNNYI